MTVIFNEAPTPPESKTEERLDQIEAFCQNAGSAIQMLAEKIEALQRQVDSQPADPAPPTETFPAEIPATRP